MPILLPGEPVFNDLRGAFVSPFPSSDARGSAKWGALADANPGAVAALQTMAWSKALRLSMKQIATSPLAGGFRTQWLQGTGPDSVRLIVEQQGYTGTSWGGLFADVGVNPSDDWKNLGKQLFGDPEAIGANLPADLFGAAVNFLSSNTGVYGQILKAVVAIGRFFLDLAGKKDSPIALITVPWQEYSRDTDEDLVNTFLVPLMAEVDWTALFSPPMMPTGFTTFQLAETHEGENTRSYGIFGAGEKPTPAYGSPGSGWGFMPGTQQMAEVIQMAALGTKLKVNDVITNIGTFYPAVSQYATAAESMINRNGNADMFKIQPAKLEERWTAYFDGYFGEGFDQLERFRRGKTDKDEVSARLLSKAIWQFIIGIATNQYESMPALGSDFTSTSGNLPLVTKPNLFQDGQHPDFHNTTRYRPVHTYAILPALRDLRRRQMSALAHSLVCAYVRYQDVGGKTAFGAFEDQGPVDPTLPHASDASNWGDQLRRRCIAMREIFLTHLDRYKVRNQDAKDVDLIFGEQLAASKRLAPEFPIRGRDAFEPLDPQTPEAPPSKGPTGGVPANLVAVTEPNRPVGGISTPAKVAFGSVVAAGALGGLGLHMSQR